MTKRDLALAVIGTLIVLLGIALLYPNPSRSRVLTGERIEPLVFQQAHPLRRGEASYYDDGPGLYGAVHSYRWGDPKYQVTVCRADDPNRCVEVTVRDHMENPTRAIDLSPEAFKRLAPLRDGVVQVTVAGGSRAPAEAPSVTLPPTDTP